MKDTAYCVGFDSTVATCMSLVGGKGASLALLASVQEKEVCILKTYWTKDIKYAVFGYRLILAIQQFVVPNN